MPPLLIFQELGNRDITIWFLNLSKSRQAVIATACKPLANCRFYSQKLTVIDLSKMTFDKYNTLQEIVANYSIFANA